MAAVSYKDIASSVATALETSKQSEVVSSLAAYLMEERRAGDLDKIMREVERIRHDDHGVLEVDVTSARPLTAELAAQVKAMFDAKTITINASIDETLVGGAKIQAAGTLLDLSVRGQLNRLKSHNF